METLSSYVHVHIGLIILCCLFGYFLFRIIQFYVVKRQLKEDAKIIENILKKKFESIQSIIIVLKSLPKEDPILIAKFAKMKTDFLNAKIIDEKIHLSNKMTDLIIDYFDFLNIIPFLKLDVEAINTTDQIISIEKDIAKQKKTYNNKVKLYNGCICKPIGHVISRIFKYQTRKNKIIINEEDLIGKYETFKSKNILVVEERRNYSYSRKQ